MPYLGVDEIAVPAGVSPANPYSLETSAVPAASATLVPAVLELPAVPAPKTQPNWLYIVGGVAAGALLLFLVSRR